MDTTLPRGPTAAVLALSGLVLAFLFWLIYAHEGDPTAVGPWVERLPALNASLNATAAALITAALLAIRRGRRRLHAGLMVSALCASALFLTSYVVYHAFHGDTRFAGEGAIRTLYLMILASHVLLSMVVVPLILGSVGAALTRRWPLHKKLARVTAPIWLYVSVTGVVVFFFLRSYAP